MHVNSMNDVELFPLKFVLLNGQIVVFAHEVNVPVTNPERASERETKPRDSTEE